MATTRSEIDSTVRPFAGGNRLQGIEIIAPGMDGALHIGIRLRTKLVLDKGFMRTDHG
jgi:hypothetical protein